VTSQRAVFIANPAARRLPRRGDLERSTRVAASAHGLEAKIIWTDAPGHATELAREAEQTGANLVFACGGDGTLNEVLNGICGDEIVVGQVPGGTVNVWAREAGIPISPEAAIRAQLEAGDLRIDLGRAGSRRFLLMASAGFDARAVATVSQRLKRRAGPLAYLIAATRTVWRDPGFRLDLTLDDQPPLRVDAGMMVIGNTRNYGGRGSVTLEASAVDGRLDIVAFLGHGAVATARMLPGVVLGRHLQSGRVLYRRASRIVVRPALGEDLPAMQVDGDTAETATDIYVEPAAVRMLVPRPERPLFRR
jgi:diacylglycerol kinase (ATP)